MSLSFFLSRHVRAVVLWVGFVTWLTVLWTLSSGPPVVHEGPPGAAIPIDKVMHFLYFFGGGVCLALALNHTFRWHGWRLALVTALAIAAIGATDEWHQLYTPNRSGGDPYDWSADALGGIAAALTVTLIHGWLRRETHP